MFRLLVVAAIIVLAALPAAAQQQGYWYYCDPAHAYYPYASTCPVPWRTVVRTPNPYGQLGTQQTGTNATVARPATSARVPFTLSPNTVTPRSTPEAHPSAAFGQGQVREASGVAPSCRSSAI
jgi:hypothetical protein